MTIKKVVPNLETADFAGARDFYVNLFGFRIQSQERSLVTLVSPDNGSATMVLQGSVAPDLTIEVEDVDLTYTEAQRLGHEIVIPIKDEDDLGVRRFFVRAPDNRIVNVQERTDDLPRM